MGSQSLSPIESTAPSYKPHRHVDGLHPRPGRPPDNGLRRCAAAGRPSMSPPNRLTLVSNPARSSPWSCVDPTPPPSFPARRLAAPTPTATTPIPRLRIPRLPHGVGVGGGMTRMPDDGHSPAISAAPHISLTPITKLMDRRRRRRGASRMSVPGPANID